MGIRRKMWNSSTTNINVFCCLLICKSIQIELLSFINPHICWVELSWVVYHQVYHHSSHSISSSSSSAELMGEYVVKVEEGRAAADGKPSVGPVYRSIYAKDGLMELPPSISSPWDFFRSACPHPPPTPTHTPILIWILPIKWGDLCLFFYLITFWQ